MLKAYCPIHNKPLYLLNTTNRNLTCQMCPVSANETVFDLSEAKQRYSSILQEYKLPQEVFDLLAPVISELRVALGYSEPKLV